MTTRTPALIKAKRRYRTFLVALALMGSALVWLATSNYGSGLSSDGASYLSTAEHLLAGKGFTDYLDRPLVNWPPLYPILLAAVSLATGIEAFVAGQIINIVAFGVIIFLGGLLFERSLPGNWTVCVAASLILAGSLPILEVSANIASDPLFMIAVLAFLLVAQDYVRSRARGGWWAMIIIAALSSLLRYAGSALIFSGIALSFAAWRSSLRRGFAEAAAFALLAALPLAAWALFHNLPNSGTLLGSHLPADPVGNSLFAIDKVVGWFVPESVLRFVPAIAFATFVTLIFIARSKRSRWTAWLGHVSEPNLLPAAIFFVAYSGLLVFALSYGPHRFAGSQRIHVVILPMMMVLATVSAEVFLPRVTPKWRELLLAFFALWLLFPFYRIGVYVLASMQSGDISFYNIYNTRTLIESDVVMELKNSPPPAKTKIYTNNEGAAWFYLRRRVYSLPRCKTDECENLAHVLSTFGDWPTRDENAWLIWFKRDLEYKDLIPPLDQVGKFVHLELIFRGRYGNIYTLEVEPSNGASLPQAEP